MAAQVARWQCIASAVIARPISASNSSSLGRAVISFDLPSTAIWPRNSRSSQAQALTRCSGDFADARSKERRRVLPSTATTPASPAVKLLINCRKKLMELHPVEMPEQPRKGVMARNPMLELQNLSQEHLLGPAEQRHIRAVLAAAQPRAQCNQQNLMQVMARVILARVRQIRKTAGKCFQRRTSFRTPQSESKPTPQSTIISHMRLP